MEPWYTIDGIKKEGDQVRAEVLVKAESPWFSGHFPGNPVLPGLAILSIIMDLIIDSFGKGQLLSMKKIKFKKMIKPNDMIEISIASEKDEDSNRLFMFKVRNEDDLVSSGTVLLNFK